MTSSKRVVIMAGGTGGHVFPGIALAQAFAQQGIETHWLGTAGGLEANWVTQVGLPFSAITIKGLRGNGLKGWLLAPINVWRAFRQARQVLKSQQPGLVVGMGGFVCGPGGLAARSLGIPLVLHEQNAIAGLTNKLLAPLANRVFCGFEQQNLRGGKVEVVGNPVRASIEALPVLTEHQAPHILVIGGSRGAKALNEMVPQALALLDSAQRPKVIHQTGQAGLVETRQRYKDLGVDAEVHAFIDDMAQAYAQATLVIARSGALTVSELMAAARPAILIPFPFAVDDHQTANANIMLQQQAASVIQQTDLTAENLAEAVRYWLNPAQAIIASQTLRNHATPGAANVLVQKVMGLFKS